MALAPELLGLVAKMAALQQTSIKGSFPTAALNPVSNKAGMQARSPEIEWAMDWATHNPGQLRGLNL